MHWNLILIFGKIANRSCVAFFLKIIKRFGISRIKLLIFEIQLFSVLNSTIVPLFYSM